VTLATPPVAQSPDDGDVYDDLLRETRGLRREHAVSREAWLSGLQVERKTEQLFELEVLLKGFACFANPRNHPGPARRAPAIAQDFREHATLVREALARVVQTSRILLADRERAFVFQRYLGTVLPDDRARTLLLGESGGEDPERSLFVLRHGMTNLLEVTTGITRLPRVPFRLFFALLAMAQREVAQSTYFNPLRALEFRPEFDRITNGQMLALVRDLRGEGMRRLIALTVLSLFRILRYLALVERTVGEAGEVNKRGVATVYLALSVLRSDARALSGYLRRRSGSLLAEGFDADVFEVPGPELSGHYERLLARGHELRDVKGTLEGLAANLRLETRKAFERDFPALDEASSQAAFREAIQRALGSLRPAVQNAIIFLGRSLGANLDAAGIFEDAGARRATSERLRRDVWMFAQILRAFTTKGRSATAETQDLWLAGSPLRFVREFLAYFRAMGYPLLYSTDYPRVHAFTSAMQRLGDADVFDTSRLQSALDEAERFHGYLVELFDSLGRRDELAGMSFDRRAAAETLKLYLGE
jgi:hypothetical protein